jgi:hypothetical protein
MASVKAAITGERCRSNSSALMNASGMLSAVAAAPPAEGGVQI